MKVLVVYNSVDPHSVAGVIMAKAKYPDVDIMDIMGVTTGDITTAIGALSAVYGLILINHTVTTAATGVISPAQAILLDAKTTRTVLKTGTATAASSVNTLTASAMGAVVNAYAGMYVKTTGGTGLNQVLQIVSNSATVLTLASAWPVAISTDTTFAICATRDDFSWTIPATSGSNKRAYCAWVHEKLFYGYDVPYFISKLASDKTTNITAVNAQGVLDETYITKAAKYFLRDITSLPVVEEWNKLLFNGEKPVAGRKQTQQDMTLYGEMYKRGKQLIDTAAALTITL